MTLPMSWDEWARHDRTPLAARVRRGEVTPAELAAQAAAGIAKVDPEPSGVIASVKLHRYANREKQGQ